MALGRRFAPLLAVVVLTAACGGDDAPPSSVSQAPAGRLSGPLTVLAAASLTEAFTELGEAFQTEHPEVKVNFSFGASSTLAQQANEGAPADLLATADEANMQKVVDAGTAAGPKVFARNRLAILVGKGNPKAVAGLADLARPDVVLVLCAPEVPCGRFGAQALATAGVTAGPKSLEENVKGVVSKVTLGEADAAIVYVTDARFAAAQADSVEIPEAGNVVATYPIAALEQSGNALAASAFMAFVLSAEGQATLAKYGFLPA